MERVKFGGADCSGETGPRMIVPGADRFHNLSRAWMRARAACIEEIYVAARSLLPRPDTYDPADLDDVALSPRLIGHPDYPDVGPREGDVCDSCQHRFDEDLECDCD